MGLFNFIETFFFISLGITFMLILLLVYHFKQRLNAIEQKKEDYKNTYFSKDIKDNNKIINSK